MTTQAEPLNVPCRVCGTPGCEGQCLLPPMVRHAVPPFVAEFVAALSEAQLAQSKRCGRHSWQRRGGDWGDQENPGYYKCTVCHYTRDELEQELAELREASETFTTEINRETERADRAELAAKLNAEACAGQQQHVRQLEETNARLRGKLRHLVNERMDEYGELDRAVVVLRSGHRRTLWSLYEAGEYEPLCRACNEPECEGIDAHPGLVRREAAEDEGDES